MSINNVTGTGKTWQPLPKNYEVKGDFDKRIKDLIKDLMNDPKFLKELNDFFKGLEEKGMLNFKDNTINMLAEIIKNNQSEKMYQLPKEIKDLIRKHLNEKNKKPKLMTSLKKTMSEMSKSIEGNMERFFLETLLRKGDIKTLDGIKAFKETGKIEFPKK